MTISNGQLANQTSFNTAFASRSASQSIAGDKTFTDSIIAQKDIRRSVENGITAFAGGGQASAYALSKDLNVVSVCATSGDSVKLPTALAGRVLVLFNNGATSCDVFPFLGEFIDALTVNAAIGIASGGIAEFHCKATGQWLAIYDAEYNDLATHVSGTAVHGATGSVVGTTNTQTLTNKTLTSPTLTTPTTEIVTFDDQASTPSNPSAGFLKLYFKTDGILYSLNSSGTESVVGYALSSTTPADVASTGSVGVGTTSARSDHVHRGVLSVNKSGDTTLYGAVTFTGTGSTTLTQVGQNVQISSSAGASSPLTTKGDIWGYSTLDARIPIGTNNYVLTADSTQTLGLKWAPSSGGGGGSFVWELPDSNAPADSVVSGVPIFDFWYEDVQEIWAYCQVPSTYVAGVQILLKNLRFATPATTGKILFRVTTYLVRAGTEALGSFANSYASTNAEVTVSGTTNRVTAVGDVDLTNASGQINSISVAADDQLSIKLTRLTTSESSSATDNARFFKFSGSPKFTA